jgi:hypothetical protein
MSFDQLKPRSDFCCQSLPLPLIATETVHPSIDRDDYPIPWRETQWEQQILCFRAKKRFPSFFRRFLPFAILIPKYAHYKYLRVNSRCQLHLPKLGLYAVRMGMMT